MHRDRTNTACTTLFLGRTVDSRNAYVVPLDLIYRRFYYMNSRRAKASRLRPNLPKNARAVKAAASGACFACYGAFARAASSHKSECRPCVPSRMRFELEFRRVGLCLRTDAALIHPGCPDRAGHRCARR